MSGLRRLNLLVGKNNSGKTSVLEAVSILRSPGSAETLWESLARRHEGVVIDEADHVEIRHLLTDRVPNDEFTVEGETERGRDAFRARVTPALPKAPNRELDLFWRESGKVSQLELRLGGRELLSANEVTFGPLGGGGALFLPAPGLTSSEFADLFGDIALTREEQFLVDALRLLEPGVERIAVVAGRYSTDVRGGLAVSIAGERVPLGSLGDGAQRILGLALALVAMRGRTLVVDEIESGVHYSALPNVFRLVLETAKRLDVQVFATTHSRDAVDALAHLARAGGSDIALHRIERGGLHAVAFSETELQQVGLSDLEVR